MQNITLTAVLGWGICDLEFLENKINELGLDTDDILDELELNDFDKTNINNWIYIALYQGASNFLDKVQEFAKDNELEFDRDLVEIDIFINYLDSFLNGEILNSDIDITDFSDNNLKSFIDKETEAKNEKRL